MSRVVEIVYPVCCGIDVHKSFLVACIAVTNERSQTTHHIRRFSTFTGDLKRLADWLSIHDCKDVCLESTGKYWIPVFNVLEKSCNVHLTHPKYVKAIKGKKTDKKDAKWIAELFKCDLVRSSFIPPPLTRDLRELCRYHNKLTYMNTSEKNRGQNCLTVCNFKLDDVFTDVFGTSATRILDKIISQGHSNFDVAPLIHKRCKATPEQVRAALDGELSVAQTQKLMHIRKHMESIGALQTTLETTIHEIATPYQHQVNLILTVPGIGSRFTAIRVLAEIGVDMSVFETAKQLCSWAGLTPQNNQSANKKKTTRISRAGAYLKPLLVQCALGVVKSNKYPWLKDKYYALKKRRGHKKALIAIARKLLTAIWHMLKKDEPYNHELYRISDVPPATRVLTPEQAFALLRKQGYQIAEPVA